jgi:hypothetical protein
MLNFKTYFLLVAGILTLAGCSKNPPSSAAAPSNSATTAPSSDVSSSTSLQIIFSVASAGANAGEAPPSPTTETTQTSSTGTSPVQAGIVNGLADYVTATATLRCIQSTAPSTASLTPASFGVSSYIQTFTTSYNGNPAAATYAAQATIPPAYNYCSIELDSYQLDSTATYYPPNTTSLANTGAANPTAAYMIFGLNGAGMVGNNYAVITQSTASSPILYTPTATSGSTKDIPLYVNFGIQTAQLASPAAGSSSPTLAPNTGASIIVAYIAANSAAAPALSIQLNQQPQ